MGHTFRLGKLETRIALAYHEHGYRTREIARALGCHYATISRRLRAHAQQRHA